MAAGDSTILYGTWADFTITLASLAQDANLLAGRESTAVPNTTTKAMDYLIAGNIRVGGTVTAGNKIEVWTYAEVNATPTYPDVLDGTDSDETLEGEEIKRNALGLLAVLTIDATTNQDYWIRPTPLSKLYKHVPRNFGLFVVHDTGGALNASGHKLSYQPIKYNTE